MQGVITVQSSTICRHRADLDRTWRCAGWRPARQTAAARRGSPPPVRCPGLHAIPLRIQEVGAWLHHAELCTALFGLEFSSKKEKNELKMQPWNRTRHHAHHGQDLILVQLVLLIDPWRRCRSRRDTIGGGRRWSPALLRADLREGRGRSDQSPRARSRAAGGQSASR